jgi:hypothetical protein
MPTERIKQVAMRAGVDQRPLVVLAMDLDQRAAYVAHQRNAGRLVVDEDAGAPVRGLDAAQDDVAVVVQRVFRQKQARGMIARHVEHSRNLALRSTMPHKRGVAARAERQRKGIEENGFAGAGLAGQHGKAGREIDVQPFDQDDIADRQPGKHGCRQAPVISFPALDIHEPALSRGSRPPVCSSV